MTKHDPFDGGVRDADLIVEGWPERPHLVHFYIPTPVPLGLPAGEGITFFGEEEVTWLKGELHQRTEDAPIFVPNESTDGRIFVSLRAGRRTVSVQRERWEIDTAFEAAAGIFGQPATKRSSQDRVPGQAASEERDITVFETVTPLVSSSRSRGADLEGALNDAFDRCLDGLNELLRAYSIMTKDWRVSPLARQTVAQFVPWGAREPDAAKPRGPGVFLVNKGDPMDAPARPTLTDEQVRHLMMAVARDRQGVVRGDPVMNAAELARRAQRAAHVDADYAECLVWSYAWIEALLDAVLLMLAWEEGVNVEESGKWQDAQLIKRVTAHLPGRLKGAWNVKQTGTAMNVWERRVARVRHRVIHEQYRPSLSEAERALVACGDMEQFIKERLAKASARYPRTALIVMGEPGLLRRGGVTPEVKQAIRDGRESESWLASFVAYASDVRERSRFAG